MTQEGKLLMQEICQRLPYGLKAQVQGWDDDKEEEVLVSLSIYSVNTDGYVYFESNDYDVNYCQIEDFFIYLRPMSSMTEEENKELSELLNYEFYTDQDFALCAEDDRHRISLDLITVYTDFLISHHFDYRGLIEKGLALKAPEGMYKTE